MELDTFIYGLVFYQDIHLTILRLHVMMGKFNSIARRTNDFFVIIVL
jgi:hypothetical protein